MEPYIYKDCELPNQDLSHGSEMCEYENCKVCIDGQLIEKENLNEKLQW